MGFARHIRFVRLLRAFVHAVAASAFAAPAFAPQLSHAQASNPAPASVVLVSSHDTAAYAEAVAGIRQAMAPSGIPLRYVQPNASGQFPALSGPLSGWTAVAVGSGAVEAVRRNGLYERSFVCMVLDTGGRPGVKLVHAPELRINWMRRAVPGARTVGVLYDRVGPRGEIDALEQAAKRAGLAFRAHPVDLAYPLAAQIAPLANAVDVLLGTYDLRIYSEDTAQVLLLFSYQNRIPLLGLSDAWVRAGALFSLDWNYHDIGRQCGERVLEAIRNPGGARSGAAAVDTPRQVVYSINRKAASYFRIELGSDLVRGARRVFD